MNYKLNFPSYNFRINTDESKTRIFDVIRKKYVALTPEEWVRQHMIHYLIEEKDYPKGLIKVEGGLMYNSLQKRSDIVVFNTDLKAMILVECKAPEVKISDNTLKQLSTYNSKYKASLICATNGISHYVYELDFTSGKILPLKDIPTYKKTGS